MATMLDLGNMLIRISPKNSKRIEYSKNQGRSRIPAFLGSFSIGNFIDLCDAGNEILGTTDKGLCYSRTKGRSWIMRTRNK